ncbi:MAG TPA: hypothetical protein VMG82_21690 [Candidatus Sulfotelmatobacter sp.]|nr:hypothetical protein [Candidatus Sulfotelmatobacter sp.]
MTDKTTSIVRIALSTALMALAANCFLKYLWWTACYSAWQGIPKLANQWKAADTRASCNGWSVIALELSSVAVLFTALRLRSSNTSGFFRNAPRLILSFVIAIAATGVFALALSWVKQGIE